MVDALARRVLACVPTESRKRPDVVAYRELCGTDIT
jgi:hypothetical protein